MKKILAIALALVMMFACVGVLAACDSTGDGEETTTEAATTPAATTEAATTEEKNDEDEDAKKPVLKMGTNAYFQPYEYYDGENIIGIDAEFAALIAEKLGMTGVIVDMEFDTFLTGVNEGSVDFGMAGMTVTPDREKEVDFSISYANGKQVVIVKEDSPITHVDDLFAKGATYTAGVQLGTTGDIYATGDLGEDRVTAYNNANNAVMALVAGDIDCVIIDNEPAKALVEANAGLKILEPAYAAEDYAICVKKGNSALLEKLNDAILALTEEGKIDEVLDKYIK